MQLILINHVNHVIHVNLVNNLMHFGFATNIATQKKEDFRIATSSNSGSVAQTVLLVLMGLIILGSIGWLVWKKPFSFSGLSAGTSASDTADSIRGAFGQSSSATTTGSVPQIFGSNPPGNASTSAPAAGDISTAASTNTPSNPLAASSRHPRGINNAPLSSQKRQWQATSLASNVAGESVYRNENLKFEINLPSAWSSQVQDQGSRVIFFKAAGAQAGYVESYDNSAGVSLNDLAATLQSSPDVSSVTQTSVSGQPALYYTGRSSGIALIYGNKIYYLHDQLANIRSNIKFF